jgi:uncharacterized protein
VTHFPSADVGASTFKALLFRLPLHRHEELTRKRPSAIDRIFEELNRFPLAQILFQLCQSSRRMCAQIHSGPGFSFKFSRLKRLHRARCVCNQSAISDEGAFLAAHHKTQGDIHMAGKFEIKKSKAGFSFNLKANNGQVILTSEVYKDKKKALNGIASVKKNAGNDARYEVKKSTKGAPYFVLLATNNEIIGKSEMYASMKSCKGGMASVKKFAAEASTVDLTE